MTEFNTVNNSEYKYVVNKSEFIGICRRVRSSEEASDALTQIRKQYSDATHVCYALVCNETSRSSDDGEPSGTAGAAIAECIKCAKLNQVLVAVVRYFGGIKLGAGGLVRAYSHTAAGAINAAQKIQVAYCHIYKISYDYSVYKKIEKRAFKSLYKIISQEYNNKVEVTYAATDESFIDEVTAAACGKLDVISERCEYVERERQNNI